MDVIKVVVAILTELQHELGIRIQYSIDAKCKSDAKELLQMLIAKYHGTVAYTRVDYFCDIEIKLAFPDFISLLYYQKIPEVWGRRRSTTLP